VKVVSQVKLLASPEQAAALAETLALCNRAANLVSTIAWITRTFRQYDLQQSVYTRLKDMGLSAQPSIRTIKKVADAYAVDRKVRRGFRPDAAQPFDDRCLSWQMDQQTVSIWTTRGRVKGIRFVGSAAQIEQIRNGRQGESDLIARDGNWYLLVTCEVLEAEVYLPTDFLGVDAGIANIATVSDEGVAAYSGKCLNRVRHRNQRLRQRLQKKGTKSAKRLLKLRRRKEKRFATDTNHVISKRIVAEAQRTARGIAVEDLEGIRERVRLASPNGSRCTPGPLPSWERSWPTKPGASGCRLYRSIRPTPPRSALGVATTIAIIGPTRPPFDVWPAASLRTRTTTQHATSPKEVERAGLASTSRTRERGVFGSKRYLQAAAHATGLRFARAAGRVRASVSSRPRLRGEVVRWVRPGPGS
jgi:putative transposase